MNSKSISVVYFLLLITELIGEYLIFVSENGLLVFISKPLLMICLMFLAFHSNQKTKILHFNLLFFALLFSMFGDISLMFLPYFEGVFIIGLGCFLVAHLFYIWLFTKPANSKISVNPFFIILPLIYGVCLIYYLFQQNTQAFVKMQIPVIIYAGVILLMLIAALHRQQRVSINSFKWVAVGALLFVLSDTTIALNKFTHVFEDAELVARLAIMILYGIAQFMIVKGLILAANHTNKKPAA